MEKCSNITTIFGGKLKMAITTISSREFNQDISRAKKAALYGPVFITDRGHPAHVLLAIEDYEKIIGTEKNIIELLAMPDADDIAFEPAPLNKKLYNPADFK